MKTIGDRMKDNYESRQSHSLTCRVPVIIRVDGVAFHTFTKRCARPFDARLHNAMVLAAKKTAKRMQGFKLAYIQSDEVSFLLTDYDTLTTEAWFDYDQAKLASVTASIMTAEFNATFKVGEQLANFDGRAFNVPEGEVANYFLWRAKDWERNSLSMYARSFYSHRALEGKSKAAVHEMLHAKGRNWATLSPWERTGTFILRDFATVSGILPVYEHIAGAIGCLNGEE